MCLVPNSWPVHYTRMLRVECVWKSGLLTEGTKKQVTTQVHTKEGFPWHLPGRARFKIFLLLQYVKYIIRIHRILKKIFHLFSPQAYLYFPFPCGEHEYMKKITQVTANTSKNHTSVAYRPQLKIVHSFPEGVCSESILLPLFSPKGTLRFIIMNVDKR